MKLSVPISVLLLAGCLTTLVSCNRNQDAKDSDVYIARNMLEHTIVNESLKNELIQYDNRFKDFKDAQNKGLEIMLESVSRDSVIYHIGYAGGLTHGIPALICEPVNGKPVALWLSCLEDFQLPPDKSVEVLKDLSPKEYELYQKNKEDIEVVDGDTIRRVTLILSDFVGLRLVYDRDNNLIRRDTTGWY